MKFEDALKLLKNHYNWRITATGSNPDGFELAADTETMSIKTGVEG